MARVRQILEIGGRQIDLLFTPSIYAVAKRRGFTIEITDAENLAEVLELYAKLVYLAALNALEAKRFDNPAEPDLPVGYIDVAAWAAEHSEDFMQLVDGAIEALTGKSLKEVLADGDGKKKDEAKGV